MTISYHCVGNCHLVYKIWVTGAKGDGGGGDNWSYKTCFKAPVKSSPPTN